MSIVRHLVKLKEKKDKELREEAEVNNHEGTGVLVPETNEDPIQDMTYTETCLGSVDFERTQVAAASIVPNKRGRYQKYSESDRYKIGKYGSEIGATAAVRKYKKTIQH